VRDIIITLMVMGALPFIFIRPYLGVILWSWLAYMNPHRLTYGFAYTMPFAAITAGVVLVAMVFSKEKLRIPRSPVVYLWAALILWMCLTTPFALMPDAAYFEWKRFIKIQLMTLITLILITDREKLNHLVWIIVFSLGFFGFKGGLFTIATAGSFRVWGPPDTFVEGNNELALALIMVLPLMRYIQMEVQNKWIKRLMLAAMLLTALSIMASYSRGAFLAAAAMFLVFWLKSKRKVVLGIVLTLAAVVAVAFMPDEWGERMGTISEYEDDGSALGRINAWMFAFNLAKDRPLVGGGFGAFKRETFATYAPEPENFHDAHSIYFEVLGEHGFVGLTLFLVFWIVVLKTGNWTIKRTRDRPDLSWANNLTAMCQTGLIGYAVGGAFLGLAYYDLPYHLMTIIVITRVIVERELEATQVKIDQPAVVKRKNQFQPGRFDTS